MILLLWPTGGMVVDFGGCVSYRIKRISRVGAVVACAFGALTAVLPGCAAVIASRQPNKRDLGVLDPGIPRTHVIAELGPPVWSEKQDGRQVDVFAFKQGYAKTTKAARALAHGAADVATFGLWEVVGVPAETLVDGTEVQLEVHYDAKMSVERVVVIKGEKALKSPKLFPTKHVAPSRQSGTVSRTAALPTHRDSN